MSKKPFLKSSIRDIDEELAEIDLDAVALQLDAPLPGEEVIGELNDFEKRAMIWPQLIFEELKKVSRPLMDDRQFLTDDSVFDQYMLETDIMQSKVRLLRAKYFASLTERFGADRPLGIRSNFKVVISKKTEADLKVEKEQLNQAASWELHNCLHGHQKIN